MKTFACASAALKVTPARNWLVSGARIAFVKELISVGFNVWGLKTALLVRDWAPEANGWNKKIENKMTSINFRFWVMVYALVAGNP